MKHAELFGPDAGRHDDSEGSAGEVATVLLETLEPVHVAGEPPLVRAPQPIDLGAVGTVGGEGIDAIGAPARAPQAPFTVMSRARIMLVDDEPTTLEVVQTYLEEAGYTEFVSTSVPGEALPGMRAAPPDLLLLDLMMPGISGFEILAALRADEGLRYTPVIVLTAATDGDTKLRALELGATDFLSKPVDASELTLRVRNALAFKSYQDRLANVDALTGLPNRRTFIEAVDETFRQALHDRRTYSLLSIDLDRFKQINDSFGHKTGDRVLGDAAQRIRGIFDEVIGTAPRSAGAVPFDARLARTGGDEFMAMLPETAGANTTGQFIRRLQESFQDAFPIGDQDVFITPSIGVAVLPVDGDDAEALIKNAETAMRQAKSRGANNFEFYSRDMNSKAYERLSLESALRKALERDELVLHYQPKVDANTLRLVGVEALVRWQHPQRGMIPPGVFIPIAEETGLIGEIGAWVMNEACRQAIEWQRAGLPAITMAVNMSVVQFKRRLALPAARHALAKSGLDPRMLVLELTESVLMENPRDGEKTLHDLRALGVRLSVDDFGTGYSSLTYLQKFPIDELKIDRSFVAEVARKKDSRAIVAAIVALGRALGLRIVAEGVETVDQVRFLRERGCTQLQGFLFGRPVPAPALEASLRKLSQRSAGATGQPGAGKAPHAQAAN